MRPLALAIKILGFSAAAVVLYGAYYTYRQNACDSGLEIKTQEQAISRAKELAVERRLFDLDNDVEFRATNGLTNSINCCGATLEFSTLHLAYIWNVAINFEPPNHPSVYTFVEFTKCGRYSRSGYMRLSESRR